MTTRTIVFCLAMSLLGWMGPARADVLVTRYYDNASASITLPPVFPLMGAGFAALEGFGSRPGGDSFMTDFGTSGSVLGVYSGNFSIQPLPGPAHAGQSIAAGPSGTLFTLTIAHGPDVPDIDFFGLDVSSISPGTLISFLNAGQTVMAVSGADILGGGPLIDQFGHASFVGFQDLTGTFDQVVFGSAGAFVSDYHVIGSLPAPGVFSGTPVDEPASAVMVGVALVGFGTVRRIGKRKR